VRIFKTKWFARFCRRESIPVSALRVAVRRAQAGHVDADLGHGLVKLRLARPGQGRAGGYRVICVRRHDWLVFLVFGFAKSRKSNLEPDDLIEYSRAARHFLSLDDSQIARLCREGKLTEISPDGEETEE
jgi:hypothetical protein